MSKRVIILIGHQQRRGKDTFARLLQEYLKDYSIQSIAAQIKKEYGQINGWSMEEVEELKNNHPSVRKELIEMGAVGRLQYVHYWTDRVLDNTQGNIIIPDFRFRDEYNRCLEEGHRVFTVKVDCSREVAATRGTLSNEDDPTETSLADFDDWDFIVPNEGDLNQLRHYADMVADCVTAIIKHESTPAL